MQCSFVDHKFTEEQFVAGVMRVFKALDTYVQDRIPLYETTEELSADDVAMFLGAASMGVALALGEVEERRGPELTVDAWKVLEGESNASAIH
jgi:hypothetical protein